MSKAPIEGFLKAINPSSMFSDSGEYYGNDDDANKAFNGLSVLNVFDAHDETGNNVLLYAAQRSFTNTAMSYLNRFSAQKKDPDFVKALFTNPITNYTAIHYAAIYGNYSLLGTLLDWAPNLINETVGNPAKTALDFAMELGNDRLIKPQMVELIKEKGGIQARQIELERQLNNLPDSAEKLNEILSQYKSSPEIIRQAVIKTDLYDRIYAKFDKGPLLSFIRVLGKYVASDSFRDKASQTVEQIAIKHYKQNVYNELLTENQGAFVAKIPLILSNFESNLAGYLPSMPGSNQKTTYLSQYLTTLNEIQSQTPEVLHGRFFFSDQNGWNGDFTMKNELTALDAASRLGHVELAEFLIDSDISLLTMQNQAGENALHIAAKEKTLKLFDLLESKKCDEVQEAMNQKNKSGETVLDVLHGKWAQITNDDDKAVFLEKFIDLGSKLSECKNKTNFETKLKKIYQNQYTNLINADKPDIQKLDQLLTKSPDLVNFIIQGGIKAIHISVIKQNEELFRYLTTKSNVTLLETVQCKNILHYAMDSFGKLLAKDPKTNDFILKSIKENSSSIFDTLKNAKNSDQLTPLDIFFEAFNKSQSRNNKSKLLSWIENFEKYGMKPNKYITEIQELKKEDIKSKFIAAINNYSTENVKALEVIIARGKELGLDLVSENLFANNRNSLFVAIDKNCPEGLLDLLLKDNRSITYKIDKPEGTLVEHAVLAYAEGKIKLADANKVLDKVSIGSRAIARFVDGPFPEDKLPTLIDKFFEKSGSMDIRERVVFLRVLLEKYTPSIRKPLRIKEIKELIKSVKLPDYQALCQTILSASHFIEADKKKLDAIFKEFPEFINEPVEGEKTVLTLAVYNGKIELAKYFLSKNAEIQNNLLSIAMVNKNYDFINHLVSGYATFTPEQKVGVTKSCNYTEDANTPFILDQYIDETDLKKIPQLIGEDDFKMVQKLIYLGAKSNSNYSTRNLMQKYEQEHLVSFDLSKKISQAGASKGTNAAFGLGLGLAIIGVLAFTVPPISAALGASLIIVASVIFAAAAISMLVAGISYLRRDKFKIESVQVTPEMVQNLLKAPVLGIETPEKAGEISKGLACTPAENINGMGTKLNPNLVVPMGNGQVSNIQK